MPVTPFKAGIWFALMRVFDRNRRRDFVSIVAEKSNNTAKIMMAL